MKYIPHSPRKGGANGNVGDPGSSGYRPIIIIIAIALAGCATVSETTGTSFADRCVKYRTALAVTKALPPSEEKRTWIIYYSALLEACPKGG